MEKIDMDKRVKELEENWKKNPRVNEMFKKLEDK